MGSEQEATLAALNRMIERSAPEWEIVGVAIRNYDGRTFVLPRPYRHLIRVMAALGEPTPIDGEQGFVRGDGKFLRRKVAGRLADRTGQAKRTKGSHVGGDLFSEDVW